MSNWIIILFCLIGVAVWWRWSRHQRPQQTASLPASPYRCVAIRPNKTSCGSAKRLAGKRFLIREAPRFPLASCDAAVCPCKYAHFNDRRSGEERRGSRAVQRGHSIAPGSVDQRLRPDRRKSPQFGPSADQSA